MIHRKLEQVIKKWKRANARLPKAFADNYPNVKLQVVTPENYWEFV